MGWVTINGRHIFIKDGNDSVGSTSKTTGAKKTKSASDVIADYKASKEKNKKITDEVNDKRRELQSELLGIKEDYIKKYGFGSEEYSSNMNKAREKYTKKFDRYLNSKANDVDIGQEKTSSGYKITIPGMDNGFWTHSTDSYGNYFDYKKSEKKLTTSQLKKLKKSSLTEKKPYVYFNSNNV